MGNIDVKGALSAHLGQLHSDAQTFARFWTPAPLHPTFSPQAVTQANSSPAYPARPWMTSGTFQKSNPKLKKYCVARKKKEYLKWPCHRGATAILESFRTTVSHVTRRMKPSLCKYLNKMEKNPFNEEN